MRWAGGDSCVPLQVNEITQFGLLSPNTFAVFALTRCQECSLPLVQDLDTCSRPLQIFVDICEDKMDRELFARIWPMKSLPLQETTFKVTVPLIVCVSDY